MTKKTKNSRGESWGIKAAHGTKWLINKIKAFDKCCVARTKSKNRPSWLGHIPLVSMTLVVIALLAYFSLYILFAFGLLVILFSVIANISNFPDDSFQTSNEDEDGYRAGYSGYGFYVGGIRVDNDD